MTLNIYPRLLIFILFTIYGVNGVAKFEVTSISDSSLVIKMVEAGNVTNFDITVQIFDLSKQKLFRRTQLDHVKNDQVSLNSQSVKNIFNFHLYFLYNSYSHNFYIQKSFYKILVTIIA